MNEPPDPSWMAYQRQMDDQNINTLVVLHRVYAGLLALGSCCVFGYLALFFGVMTATEASKPQPPPPAILGFVGLVWGAVLLLVIGLSVMNFLSANWLRDRRNWLAIVIVSALNCLTGILGIGLAVYTIVVVNRPGVRGSFQ